MERRHRMLVAAEPAAAGILTRTLGDQFDPIFAHATADAVAAAQRGGIELIVCTIAFDDSRMFDFLEASKRDSRTSGVPFVCCSVLRSIMSAESMERLADACRFFGAADFVDLPRLEEKLGLNAAIAHLRSVLMMSIEKRLAL